MPPAVARAQWTPAKPAARYSTACINHLPPSTFTRVAVYATLEFRDSASSTFAMTADNLLQDLVTIAQKLLGAKSNILPEGEPTIDWRGVDDELHLTAFRDGRIVAKEPAPGAAAAALMARALKEDSTPALLDFTADSRRDSISFDLRFVRPTLDSAGHVSKPQVTRAALPLLSVSAPWERQVAPMPGGAPTYPDQARRNGYEGTALMQFIVDSTGRAVDSTVRDLWPHGAPKLSREKMYVYQSFVEAARQAIPHLRFIPATIGGCPVNQLVQMPFKFTQRR